MITTEFDRLEAEVELQTKRNDLLHLLAAKFGPVPETTAARVRKLQDTDELDRLLIRFVHANSLEEMMI